MILIIDCGSSKTPFIEDMVDFSIDYQTVGMNELSPINLTDFDGIIISGAPILLTEVQIEPYIKLFEWIKSYEKPILGICFGHQIIGLTFGAFVSRQKEDRDWQTIEIIEENELFDKLPTEIKMMEDHCESVSIPTNFKLLACSDSCINEAMTHLNKPIFGVQFHPEVSGNYGQTLINNFVDICLKKKS
jgi:GMP synthase (glutamine-hydrolysing)